MVCHRDDLAGLFVVRYPIGDEFPLETPAGESVDVVPWDGYVWEDESDPNTPKKADCEKCEGSRTGCWTITVTVISMLTI